jgi:hypothetical protein
LVFLISLQLSHSTLSLFSVPFSSCLHNIIDVLKEKDSVLTAFRMQIQTVLQLTIHCPILIAVLLLIFHPLWIIHCSQLYHM